MKVNPQFNKIVGSSLPNSLKPNTFYFLENGNYAESYLTSETGVAKALGNSEMINDLIDIKISGVNSLFIVADIQERDALSIFFNTLIFVEDASDDVDIVSGWALYLYRTLDGVFIRVSSQISQSFSNSYVKSNATLGAAIGSGRVVYLDSLSLLQKQGCFCSCVIMVWLKIFKQ